MLRRTLTAQKAKICLWKIKDAHALPCMEGAVDVVGRAPADLSDSETLASNIAQVYRPSETPFATSAVTLRCGGDGRTRRGNT